MKFKVSKEEIVSLIYRYLSNHHNLILDGEPVEEKNPEVVYQGWSPEPKKKIEMQYYTEAIATTRSKVINLQQTLEVILEAVNTLLDKQNEI